MAAMYAVYHGPAGLRRIAGKIHGFTQVLKAAIENLGYKAMNSNFFDTLTIDVSAVLENSESLHAAAEVAGINLRIVDDKHAGVTLDESVTPNDLVSLINVFASAASSPLMSLSNLSGFDRLSIPSDLLRRSEYLPHAVFNRHHSETEMLRYIQHLASKDLSLVHAMIPLGSCTMKLNSTSSMIPLTWPEFSAVHPFAPTDQVNGYLKIIKV
jgi:glycine dehydrogenase